VFHSVHEWVRAERESRLSALTVYRSACRIANQTVDAAAILVVSLLAHHLMLTYLLTYLINNSYSSWLYSTICANSGLYFADGDICTRLWVTSAVNLTAVFDIRTSTL